MTNLIYASPQEAKAYIRSGNVPDGLYVQGNVDLSGDLSITEIPAGFVGCHRLILDDCANLTTLPDFLEVDALSIKNCKQLHTLPADLRCSEVLAMGSGMRQVPPTIRVDKILDLSHCYHLETLPDGLEASSKVSLSGCANLRQLPKNWTVKALNIIACTSLKELPDGLICGELDGSGCGLEHINNNVQVTKKLSLYMCANLVSIDGIKSCNHIDLSNCPKLNRLPEKLKVAFELNIGSCSALEQLPSHLQCNALIANESGLKVIPDDITVKRSLNLTGCKQLTQLPDTIKVHELILSGCEALKHLPMLNCHKVDAANARIETVAGGSQIVNHLVLAGCRHLTSIGSNLTVKSLVLRGCTALERLPDDLHVSELVLNGCINFTTWGEHGSFTNTVAQSRINVVGCTRLTYLPDWFKLVGWLDVRNCPNLKTLPENLVVKVIELADSGLTSLPQACADTRIRWNSVEITPQIAFEPQTLTYQQVLSEENLEMRRIMIERMGYERFFAEAEVEEVDCDNDAGGIRRLLRVDINPANNGWWGMEPILCLAVICPSTGRRYVLRVPPQMNTCQQAAAWIAGFDDPEQYKPIHET